MLEVVKDNDGYKLRHDAHCTSCHAQIKLSTPGKVICQHCRVELFFTIWSLKESGAWRATLQPLQ